MSMQWRRISDYCIGNEAGYKIAKSYSSGAELYGLSYQGEHIKFYRSADAAKTAAQRHAEDMQHGR